MHKRYHKMELTELDRLRKEQDAIDLEIVQALARRYALRKRISAFRIGNNLPTVDPERRNAVLTQVENYASRFAVPEKMVNEIFVTLIEWSHRWDIEWRAGKE